MGEPEVFVPLSHPIGRAPPVTSVRSTLVVSALQTLRARGLYDRYFAELAPECHDEIRGLIAGAWTRVALGLEHYRAMNRLGLDRATIEGIGGEVGERANKSMLSVIVRLSREVGVSPWTALGHAHRVRDMMWKGSDVAVWKLGPKEARFDWVAQPLSEVPYFVTSFGGFLRAFTGLFARRVYANAVPALGSPTSFAYRLSWV